MKTLSPVPAVRTAWRALALAAVLLAGCASAGAGREPTAADPMRPAAAPLACARDADCVVKDVGNCCGYYPACVHVDQPVDPGAVQRECREQGLSSICGFPEITACACVDGACRPADSPQ